ncbi:hypothetical protein BGY98DRAFT_2064 [Russula aff. rugulosa BPL654]|nr:hypothetical protein BGY98DRAFT_2064 [Russula aff. rugulosa BPL654]
MHCRLWASPSCFFLLFVTFLSHRHHHLALAAVLHTRSSSSSSSPPRSPLPSILSRGVAPRPAIDSDRAILSWANGRSHPKIKRSSRLLLGSAWVGRTRVGHHLA